MTRDANTAITTTTTIPLNNSFTLPSTVLFDTTCLAHIFSFLSRTDLTKTTLVSKSWHTASTKVLWANFKFVREKDFERIFRLLAKMNNTTRYGNHILSLELIHSDRDFCISSNHIFLITMLCPNLESIQITFHHTRPVAPPVRAAVMNGDNKPRLPPPMLARNHVAQLPAQQPQPQPSSQQPYTTSLPLAHFAFNCLRLKSIRLTSYTPKTDDSVYEMAKYLTSGTLESIQLINCSTIQSSTLSKLAMTNPQLKCVEIMGSTPINDSSLATIADRCGNSLENLSIGNAHSLTDKSIRYIPARCKKIKQICIINNNVERISENTLSSIIRHCPTLQALSLSDSRVLGPLFFEQLVDRIKTEMNNISAQKIPIWEGLKLLCLGAVKREIIQCRFTQELIETSASKHDSKDNPNDSDEETTTTSDQITHLINNTSANRFIPKSIIIRGDTIWWQRRRIIFT